MPSKKLLVVVLAVMCISASFSPAYAADKAMLSRTGQTISFAAHDDGDLEAGLAWPSPRFINNGDGTITDNLTGLMWLRDANLSYTLGLDKTDAYGNDAGLPGGWKQAMGIIDNLNFGIYTANNAGYSDWRLPNVLEIESLTTAGTGCYTMLNSAGFTGAVKAGYATATTPAAVSTGIWYINMLCGRIVYVAGQQSGLHIMAVRGHTGGTGALVRRTGQTNTYAANDDGALQEGVPWPSPRFALNPDNSVTDNLTGLSWARDAGTPAFGAFTSGRKSWADALAYIDALNAGNYLGHTDWRLPNRRELASLVDYSQYKPAVPAGHPFINVKTGSGPDIASNSPNFYWSSTAHYIHTDSAFYLDLYTGQMPFALKTYAYFAWPVRGPSAPVSPPPPPVYTLSVNASPSEGGTVALSPSGGSYGPGTQVTVTATPAGGYTFTGWSGALAGTTNPAVVTMDASKGVTANFAPAARYTLTFTAGPNGAISGTTPQAVDYGGSSTPVTALPNTGYHLVNWTGTNGFVATTANPLTVTNVSASQDMLAGFAVNQYTVTFLAGPHGKVTGASRQTVDHGGSTTQVTAVPSRGYRFIRWAGPNGFVSTANPLVLTNVTVSQRITTNFGK